MKLTIVLVLYKKTPEESKTFLTLKQTLFSNKNGFNQFELILYDNSPEKQEFNPLKYEGVHMSYVHDPRNLGIVPAYNHAWKIANENGSKWILLLDHDTELTQEYMNEVMDLADFSEEIVAVVPKIMNENTMISPVYSNSLRPLLGDRPESGIQENPVMAINSGAIIRIDFLNEIGGFNEEFPLDYLDHWLFYEIYAKGKKVWVLDSVLEHELSVMDYSRVSLKRYQSILESELNFYSNYKTELFSSFRKQLLKRFLKQVLTVKNKQIALHTLRQFFKMSKF
ncbi:glycosyltransferase [Neobacillus rhizophilus]|uniref:Glycosyltransferase n=1 Tax=Neobacillus rhizophilus TaxID=2833579 RepID=A0A942U630_9BACI|nr:glycosyltransferase [Neobacillus rhizophilus]MBS4213122.1 glycosyltransferase [Neobacillus rhizophilus]MBU8914755.1 glycosyltransferase [Bacillus sp. FJAT-29953]